jgi:hypothetical protein
MTNPADTVWSSSERKLLEEGLIPSASSVELEKKPISDFMQRFASRQVNVAELFHENSKLSPHSTVEVPSDHRKLVEVRDWFFETAYKIRDDEIKPDQEHLCRIRHLDLPPGPAEMLATVALGERTSELLYAIDMLVLQGEHLYRTLPRSEFLWVERVLTEAQVQSLKSSIPDMHPRQLAGIKTFLILVACPWRYMLLYGPRGYRHTLLDAGRLICRLEQEAEHAGCRLLVAPNFYDHRVDRILYNDGVERSALVMIGLKGDA